MIPRCPHTARRAFFKGVPKRKQGAEMMPLTCAPLGHWPLAIGIWDGSRGGGEPDDWLPRAGGPAACERRPFPGLIRLTPDASP